ncbi:hypothetical protein [Streptomyces sp. NPDC048361]|uniref:hypothetical protein n=1 Tax=Streptomyces sp. NPDC048361 TaxID=3154720 RepID=UPI003420541D
MIWSSAGGNSAAGSTAERSGLLLGTFPQAGAVLMTGILLDVRAEGPPVICHRQGVRRGFLDRFCCKRGTSLHMTSTPGCAVSHAAKVSASWPGRQAGRQDVDDAVGS